jgi:DNA-damage-inducible protein D
LGEDQISEEHVKNNQDVRNLLAKSNILPERLPPEEDIKKLEKYLEKENKNLMNSLYTLPESRLPSA